jgi:glycerol 3-phosphatase-1
MCSSVSPELILNLDVSHVEGLIPKQFGLDAVEIPGARDLLASLEKAEAPWAMCVHRLLQ